MIHSFEIHDPKNTPIKWWEKVEALSKPRLFEFKPGLNVLWGRNGSGKTTVIKALAKLFHCEQSGNPVVTQESIRNLFDRWSFGAEKGGEEKLPKAVTIKHDGQGVRYFDPSIEVGLMAGGAAFDWDFGTEGIQNKMFKGSSGQTNMFRFDKLLGSLFRRDPPPKIERRIKADSVNDYWNDRVKMADAFLKGSSKEGTPTILLDEPERSFDINHQVGVWRMLRAFAPTTQFIVASHSLFALRIPEAHYIELSPDYLKGSENALDILAGWSAEKPEPPPAQAIREAEKAKPKAKAR